MLVQTCCEGWVWFVIIGFCLSVFFLSLLFVGECLSLFNFSFNSELLLVGVNEVGVELDALREGAVEAGGHAHLVLLQLGQVADHQGVVKVRHHLTFEQVHVVRGELPQTILQLPTQCCILVNFSSQDIFNESFALGQIGDDLSKVPRQELLVGQKTLLFQQFTDLVLIWHVASLQDRHGVIVLLAVENDVHARLFVLFQVDLEGALRKDLHLLDALSLLFILFVRPLGPVHLRRHHKTQHLSICETHSG